MYLTKIIEMTSAVAIALTLMLPLTPELEGAGPALEALESIESLQQEDETCCFNNPAYSGTCRVTPGEGETCASILAYLNNPMADGKSYCGGTAIRRGWQQVSCEDGS